MVPRLKIEVLLSLINKGKRTNMVRFDNNPPEWPDDEDHATGGREA